jgi:hypothetical protein
LTFLFYKVGFDWFIAMPICWVYLLLSKVSNKYIIIIVIIIIICLCGWSLLGGIKIET